MVKFFIKPKKEVDIEALRDALLKKFPKISLRVADVDRIGFGAPKTGKQKLILIGECNENVYQKTFDVKIHSEEENIADHFDNKQPQIIQVWKEDTKPKIPDEFKDQITYVGISYDGARK